MDGRKCHPRGAGSGVSRGPRRHKVLLFPSPSVVWVGVIRLALGGMPGEERGEDGPLGGMVVRTKHNQEGREGSSRVQEGGPGGSEEDMTPEMSRDEAGERPRLWQSGSGGREGAGGRNHGLCRRGFTEKGRGLAGALLESPVGRGDQCISGLRVSEGGEDPGAGEMVRCAEPCVRPPDLREEGGKTCCRGFQGGKKLKKRTQSS